MIYGVLTLHICLRMTLCSGQGAFFARLSRRDVYTHPTFAPSVKGELVLALALTKTEIGLPVS